MTNSNIGHASVCPSPCNNLRTPDVRMEFDTQIGQQLLTLRSTCISGRNSSVTSSVLTGAKRVWG